MRFLRIGVGLIVVIGAALLASRTPGSASSLTTHYTLNCAQATVCADVAESEQAFGEDQYVGHDEPSTLFYSNTPGSGNNFTYHLILPKDPVTPPQQNGNGGTTNFMLHPAFWFGVAMCDTQSYPQWTQSCTPDSDTNIFDSGDPNNAGFIGHHPGTAFMEMQFYPPGWVTWPAGDSCAGTKWCAALNIDSLSQNAFTGQSLNPTCQGTVGSVEYVNFAFITRNGTTVGHGPANPFDSTIGTYTPNSAVDLNMNSGDELVVAMRDTAAGFVVQITDFTTQQSGSMTASIANGFGQINAAPPPSNACSVTPYAFHPMYATSSEHTRVPWAAHSYNVAFADETGHFEYCTAVSGPGGGCTATGVNDPGGVDADDEYCFPSASSSFYQIAGCYNEPDGDFDFDGPMYGLNWPGTLANQAQDLSLHGTPITFSSPVFNTPPSNYDRVAFEANLPRIELNVNPPCDRNTGQNCTNPPQGASFYPFFTARTSSIDPLQTSNGCLWQLGGTNLPSTIKQFGGNSTAEYGPLLLSTYAGVGGTSSQRYNNFRNVLTNNPCQAGSSRIPSPFR